MRIPAGTLIVVVGVGLSACTREKTDSAAREVGRQAAELKQDAEKVAAQAKQAARKAGRELKRAGQEVREGWYQAHRQDRPKDKQ
jgi:Sec-independent protein translocase protein TatA